MILGKVGRGHGGGGGGGGGRRRFVGGGDSVTVSAGEGVIDLTKQTTPQSAITVERGGNVIGAPADVTAAVALAKQASQDGTETVIKVKGTAIVFYKGGKLQSHTLAEATGYDPVYDLPDLYASEAQLGCGGCFGTRRGGLGAASRGEAANEIRAKLITLQKVLNVEGIGPVMVTGRLGQETIDAVNRWQTARGQAPLTTGEILVGLEALTNNIIESGPIRGFGDAPADPYAGLPGALIDPYGSLPVTQLPIARSGAETAPSFLLSTAPSTAATAMGFREVSDVQLREQLAQLQAQIAQRMAAQGVPPAQAHAAAAGAAARVGARASGRTGVRGGGARAARGGGGRRRRSAGGGMHGLGEFTARTDYDPATGEFQRFTCSTDDFMAVKACGPYAPRSRVAAEPMMHMRGLGDAGTPYAHLRRAEARMTNSFGPDRWPPLPHQVVHTSLDSVLAHIGMGPAMRLNGLGPMASLSGTPAGKMLPVVVSRDDQLPANVQEQIDRLSAELRRSLRESGLLKTLHTVEVDRASSDRVPMNGSFPPYIDVNGLGDTVTFNLPEGAVPAVEKAMQSPAIKQMFADLKARIKELSAERGTLVTARR
jgi:hypothetical protein